MRIKKIFPLIALQVSIVFCISFGCALRSDRNGDNNPGSAELTNALLVVGGHRYDTAEFFDLFRSMEGIRLDSVSHPRAHDLLASDRISDYDVLLFYDFRKDLSPADSSIYLNLARQGVPMIFLHHSLCNFQAWDGYMEMVGGRYVDAAYTSDSRKVSDYKHDIDLPVRIIDKDHPVTRGMEDFTIHDEGYSNITMSESVKPLLSADHPDCFPYVAWVNQFDNSKTVYIMLGHDKQAYQNPAFSQLILNSINWLSGEL